MGARSRGTGNLVDGWFDATVPESGRSPARAAAQRRSAVKRERGFTLIELMIAITLVAALSTGMLLAMRTGLLTLDKIETRLQENRRTVSIQQMLIRQLANVMPVAGECATGRTPLFAGTDQ